MYDQTKIKKSSAGYQVVSIDSELHSARVLYVDGEICHETAVNFIKALADLAIEDPNAPVEVIISSPGGEVDSGMAIYDAIEGFGGKVTTVCIGQAYSMAAIIFAAGEERLVMGHSRVMIHQPSVMRAAGNTEQITAISDNLKKRQKQMVEILAERCGKSVKEVAKAVEKETYFAGEEAVAFGIATGTATFAEVFSKGGMREC